MELCNETGEVDLPGREGTLMISGLAQLGLIKCPRFAIDWANLAIS